jgi:DNA-binding response OmpR family regulator
MAAVMGEQSGRVSILIVEDEMLLALDSAMALEEAGYRVCGIGRDRAETLTLAERHRPDLALVDVSLADGESGFALTCALQGGYGTTCILATAYTYPLDAVEHAACARLAKPYAPEALCRAVAFCLERQAAPAPAHPPRGLELLA